MVMSALRMAVARLKKLSAISAHVAILILGLTGGGRNGQAVGVNVCVRDSVPKGVEPSS